MKRFALFFGLLSLLCAEVLPTRAASPTRQDFINQPSVITTNLAEFAVVVYTGRSDYYVSVNGRTKARSTERGYRLVVDLKLGANVLTAVIYDNKGKKKSTITKTVICDPLYKMSNRELLYAADDTGGDTFVLDPVGGYQVGYLSGIQIIAASPDGKWVVDANHNYLSVDDPSLVKEAPYRYGWIKPTFSVGGRYVWTDNYWADLKTWTLISSDFPADVGEGSVAFKNGTLMVEEYDYLSHTAEFKVFSGDQLIKTYTVENSAFMWGTIDPTGNYLVSSYYGSASGAVHLYHIKTGKSAYFYDLSDFTGNVTFTPDGKWAIIGSWGNSAFGGGYIYVFDVVNRKLKGTYPCWGSSSTAVSQSGRTVYTTSRFHETYGDDWGSMDHRGVEVFSFSSGKLSLAKSFYLKASTNYPYPPDGLIIYKRAGK
jgi:hypothetical protein